MEGKLNKTIREDETKLGVKYHKNQTGRMQRSLQLFQKSIKSEATYKVYKQHLNHFMKSCGYTKDDYDTLAKVDVTEIQTMIEDYIMAETSDTTKSPNSGGVRVFSLKAFFEINDVEINWKKILRFLPKKVKPTGKLAYTTRDIQDMQSAAKNIRTRALILFLASTGVRVGAIIELKMKHLKEMPLGCKAFCIYEGSIEEYWTFCTPECSEVLERYFAKRKQDGEVFTPETPVFLAQTKRRIDLVTEVIKVTAKKDFPRNIIENFDSKTSPILNLIRRLRNDVGHPSGIKIERMEMFTNLMLFKVYCEESNEIIEFLKNHKIMENKQ